MALCACCPRLPPPPAFWGAELDLTLYLALLPCDVAHQRLKGIVELGFMWQNEEEEEVQEFMRERGESKALEMAFAKPSRSNMMTLLVLNPRPNRVS